MLKLLKKLTTFEWIMIAISVVLIILQVWLDLKMPDYMSNITVLVQTPDSEISEILINGGYMLLCALGSLVFSIIVGYLAATISASLARTLRKSLFNNVENMSMDDIKKFKTSSIRS